METYSDFPLKRVDDVFVGQASQSIHVSIIDLKSNISGYMR